MSPIHLDFIRQRTYEKSHSTQHRTLIQKDGFNGLERHNLLIINWLNLYPRRRMRRSFKIFAINLLAR